MLKTVVDLKDETEVAEDEAIAETENRKDSLGKRFLLHVPFASGSK